MRGLAVAIVFFALAVGVRAQSDAGRIEGVLTGARGPLSGVDSTDIPAGTYQVTVTAAGTKTVLFNGQLSFAANKDLLLLTVPDATQPGGINVLVKTEGVAGAATVTPL